MEIADYDPRLRHIEELALRGMFHRASAHLRELGNPSELVGARVLCLDAWIRDHLGDGLRARRDFIRIRMAHPDHPNARFFHAYALLNERGPLEAALWLDGYVPPPNAASEACMELESLRARLYACLLDHRSADRILERCDPDVFGRPRWVAARAFLLERRDQREGALALLEEELEKDPVHRLLVQHAAALLEAVDRKSEALGLLGRSESVLEAPSLTSHRAALEHELGLFEDERQSLERLERLMTMADPRVRQGILLRRAENAYRSNDVPRALEYASPTCSPYWSKLQSKLWGFEGRPDRRELTMPVTLQEHMGCAPACIAMLSAYFGHPVNHVDVADQICYEGTASHSERGWVEQRGWISREFTVTFETARRLVQRGVPFLLVTVAIGSAHAQLVVGFDATRGTLIIRDPSTFRTVELDADSLFEEHRAYGPRGHVMLPPERAALLEGIVLPDAPLHDLAHVIRAALEDHDILEAKRLLSELEERSGAHPLSLWAARSIAVHDQDPYAVKACSERLLGQFADDVNAELSILDCLATIGSLDEQQTRIEGRLSRKEPPWVFRERLARLLVADAAQHDKARWLALRAHRAVPLRGQTVALLADIDRERGVAQRSLFERRAAATLDPTDDGLAWQYFVDAVGAFESDAAIQLLEDRVTRYRARSAGPSQVLFQALEWLDRVDEAFGVLDAALQARPEDGQLLLYAAQAHARYGRIPTADTLLVRAQGRASPAAVMEAAARIAELSSDLPLALERYEAVLEAQPLSIAAHEAFARLTYELQGPTKVRAHLAATCSKYPTHCGLRELNATWLRGHDPSRVLPELDALLALQPLHGWARRERALLLSDLGQREVAVQEATEAARLAPMQPQCHRVLGAVLLASGRREEALAAARRAVGLAPDAPGAVSELLRLAGSLEEQLELIRFIQPIVSDKSSDGGGIIEWHEYAWGLLPDDELRAHAERVRASRPELWAVHHVLAQQLLRTNEAPGARAVLEAALERFPYVPLLYVDLAEAFRAEGDVSSEVATARRVLQVAPAWLKGVLFAASVFVRSNDVEAAIGALRRGLARYPRSPELMRALTDLSWRAGEVERALREIKEAISYAPEVEAGWAKYLGYARTLGRQKEVLDYAQTLASERPWNPHVWLRLAEILRDESENEASIEALAEALERRPDFAEALDLYAATLARIGRKDAALAACERRVESYFSLGAMRARKAWVKWVFGERDEACIDMRQVIVDHPDHIWAHQVLIDWELERDAPENAVRIAQALVRLAPLNPESYTYLGAVLKEAQEPDAALEAFERAARLDPASIHAGEMRILIELERERRAEAEAVLAAQGAHVPVHVKNLWEVRIATAKGDLTRAFNAFSELALRDTTPEQTLAIAAQALAERADKNVYRDLGALAKQGGVAKEAGHHWVKYGEALNRAPSALSVWLLGRHNPETQRTAARAHFERAGDETRSLSRLLLDLIVLGGVAFRFDDVWGKVGYALTATRAYTVSQLWLSSYERRSSVEAWMLHNYRLAALNNHQPRAALRAVEHALTLPADDLLPQHLAFAAFGRAAIGDLDGARAIIAGWSPHGLDENNSWLLTAAEKLILLGDAPQAARDVHLQDLRAHAEPFAIALWPFGAGVLHRWLAEGVLRHKWSFPFFARRWALFTVLGYALYRVASISSGDFGWYLATGMGAGGIYVLLRLTI